MNKRLDELAQKAEDYADDTDLPWLVTYTKKLAELIIEECHYVTVVGGVDDLDVVLKHFGVEE